MKFIETADHCYVGMYLFNGSNRFWRVEKFTFWGEVISCKEFKLKKDAEKYLIKLAEHAEEAT